MFRWAKCVGRWLLRVFFGLIILLLLYVAYALFAFRDLPVDQVAELLGIQQPAIAMVDGVPVAYQDQGQGKPVLLLHSHFWSQRMFDAWASILEQEYRVIRMDLPGHGFTGPDPSGEYSKEREVELVLGLLDQLALEQVSIVGSSTGAATAYRLAAQEPERVDKLVLINAPGLPKGANPAMKRELPDWALPLFYLLPEAAMKSFLQFAVVDKSLITDARAREFHLFFRREGNRKAEFMRLQQYQPDADVTPWLVKVKAPTLILWGESNPQLPLAHAKLMAQKLSAAKTVKVITYPNVGHVLPIEVPDQAALDIKLFLEAGE